MQFGKLLEEVSIACGFQLFRRVATGGSTTSIQDTGLVNRYGENKFAQGSNGGHLIFISQTTDRAAPEGQYGEISAFSTPTTVPTFVFPTMTATLAAGDIYTVIKPVLQLQEFISRVNEGLRRLTQTERIDTTLTTSSGTLVYDLPLPINKANLQSVEIGNDTNGWQDILGFDVIPNSGGTADQLDFTHQPMYDSVTAANKTIRLRYVYSHPVMSIYSDYIEKSVQDNLAKSICAEAVMEHVMLKKPSYFSDESRRAIFNDIMARASQAKGDNLQRVAPPRRQSRLKLREM